MASSASKWTSCSDSEVVDWSWSELIVLPEAAGELGIKEKSPLSEWSGEEGMNPKLWFGELKHDESPESIWPIWSKLMFWNRLFIVCWWGFTELSIFCVCLFSLCFFVKVFQFSEKKATVLVSAKVFLSKMGKLLSCFWEGRQIPRNSVFTEVTWRPVRKVLVEHSSSLSGPSQWRATAPQKANEVNYDYATLMVLIELQQGYHTLTVNRH